MSGRQFRSIQVVNSASVPTRLHQVKADIMADGNAPGVSTAAEVLTNSLN